MSTTKPRITITLEPVTALQLKRISELTGNSQSSMVSEVLEQAVPVFERLIKILEAAELAKQSAKLAQRSVKLKSVQGLDDAQRRIEAQLSLAIEDFDNGTAPLLDELEKVQRRARKGVPLAGKGSAHVAVPSGAKSVARKAVSTPLSNRGVRSAQKLEKVIAQNEGPAKVSAAKRGSKMRGVF